MKYHKLNILVCVLFILVGAIGCSSIKAKPEASVSSLQPVHIEFVSSLPSFVGSESIGLVQILSLTNPNPFWVSTELSCSLFGNGENLGSSQIPKLYIPANGKVTVRDTITFDYFTLLAGKVFGGKETPAECAAILLPIWKGIGGKMPGMVKEDLWKGIKPVNPEFTIDLTVNISNGMGEKNFFQKLSWSEK